MRAISVAAFLLSLGSLTLSCSGSEPEPTPPAWTEMPVAACGMAPYALIDPATLGAVVASEEIEVLRLDRAAIKALLDDNDWNALGEPANGTRVLRFRYTTQDRGQRIEATGTLGIPQGADLPEKLPVAVFLHGTSGFSDPCAPSRDFGGQGAAALIASLGFVAVLPDYIGMNGLGAASTTTHGYLVGEQVAIGAWDAVRAGLALLDEKAPEVVPESRVVVWGGSQGGHAALYTELYAPYYAPEFAVPAVVAMVPPSTLAPLAQIAVTSWSPPTVSFGAVLATMRAWYGTPANLSAVFTDVEPYRFASTFESEVFPKDSCTTGDAYRSVGDLPENERIPAMYTPAFVDAVKAGRWSELAPIDCFLAENSLATSRVPVKRHTPTLMIYSENDDLVVTAPQREDFDRLCSQGYVLDFLECANAGHTEGAVWSLPEQLTWIRARLAGTALAGTCTRREATTCSGTPDDKRAR